MRKAGFIAAAMLALAACGLGTPSAKADGLPAVRHARVHHVCTGPHCGPYQPCGARCRIACSDRYSCAPLYGAYGPYGGIGYWGGYTFTGWGRYQ